MIYVPTFFLFNALARGWSTETLTERVKSDYTSTVRTIWVVWTPLVIFAFVALPMHQQAVFFSGFGLVWNSILSFISNRPAPVEGGYWHTVQERLHATGLRISDVASVASRGITNVRGASDDRPRLSPSPGSIVGYLMGPGLQ